MFNTKVTNESIYKHTQLDPRMVEKITPLMESAFGQDLNNYEDGKDPRRKAIRDEKIKFLSEQYANRLRIANVMGTHPLNEDAQIFGNIPQISKLFESVDSPGSIIGMGEVRNADSSNQYNGGYWNPSYKSGSGDIPSYVFGLQAHIAMYCIGFDLLPTISVDTPKVMVSFVDTVYGGGTFDDAENMPSFIEISNPIFTSALINTTAKLKRAQSVLTFRCAAGAGALAMQVLFMLKSTVKPAITVQVISTGTLDGSNVYTADDATSVSTIISTINAAAAGVAKFQYLNPSDGTTVVPVSLATGVTVVGYASATRTNIAEAVSNNNSLGGMSRAQQEKGPVNKLNVIAMDKQLEMVGIEIEADTSNIQIKDMAAMGINVIARLYNGVQNALVQTLDEIILTHLYRMGVQHMYNTYLANGVNYSLYIGAPSNANIAFSAMAGGNFVYNDMLGTDQRAAMGNVTNSIQSSGYENQMTHNDRLLARILLVAEFVGQNNRIAPPDWIVLSGGIAAAVKKHSKYIQSPVANTLSSAPELHYSGTLFETMSVYKTPRIDFNDPRILMGRRGNDTDPGSKFLAYDLAASRQTLNPDTMAEKIRVWSRFEIADIGFYPELNYATVVVQNDYNWA
jgi:hypothetical protein